MSSKGSENLQKSVCRVKSQSCMLGAQCAVLCARARGKQTEANCCEGQTNWNPFPKTQMPHPLNWRGDGPCGWLSALSYQATDEKSQRLSLFIWMFSDVFSQLRLETWRNVSPNENVQMSRTFGIYLPGWLIEHQDSLFISLFLFFLQTFCCCCFLFCL